MKSFEMRLKISAPVRWEHSPRMDISQETPAQTRDRLLKVIARTEFTALPGTYAFEEFQASELPRSIRGDALALVRDDESWSQLVACADAAKELLCLFCFHFPEGEDNSGFVGWLATQLKEQLGTGVFVVCGQNSGRGGIYDYWGCPAVVGREVRRVIEDLMRQGRQVVNRGIVEGINIRLATNRDGERILALVFEVLTEYGLRPDIESSESDLKDIEATYLKSGGVFEVVEDGLGKLLGTVGLYPVDEVTCKLRKMYLIPEARGRGLGRRMLERAIGHARRLGFKTLVLETVSVMKEAIRLYTASGFRPKRQTAVSPRCDQVYSLELEPDAR
jgi:GNAT superfamily N-acetyltransferase